MKKISDLSPSERRALLQFNWTGGPLDDIESAMPVFAAFGLAAMAWSRLETHLDALLVHLNKQQFSKEIFDPKHPVSFTRKLDLLKKWFGRHKVLAPHKAVIDRLANQMKLLGKRRNEYLHALLSAYDPQTDEIAPRSIYYAGNEEFHIARSTLNTQKLASFAAAATNTNEALGEITSKLFTRDAVEQLRRP